MYCPISTTVRSLFRPLKPRTKIRGDRQEQAAIDQLSNKGFYIDNDVLTKTGSHLSLPGAIEFTPWG